MRGALGPGGLIVEGTCDEWGRRAAWVALDADGPLTTLATWVADISTSDLAERLPKALIHHNVPGQPVHEFLRALDAGWAAAAGLSTFGPRQRWVAAVEALAEQGWPLVGSSRRWRHGEVTVRWPAVAPRWPCGGCAGETPARTDPVAGGTAELLADADRDGCWMLLVEGTLQSHVDLDDPRTSSSSTSAAWATSSTWRRRRALDVVHLGGGALTLPRYVAVTRPGSRQRVVEVDRP